MAHESAPHFVREPIEAWPAGDGSGPSCHYPGGVVLFRQDDPIRTLYLIDTGVVKLTRRETSHELLVGLRADGWLLGTSAAILGQSHPVTATTLGECDLRQMPVVTVSPERRADPKVALCLHQMQAREALEQVAMLGVFGLSHPRPRLEYLLRRLASAGGAMCNDGSIKLINGLTHEEFAQAIGTSRESVTRLLGQLSDEGVIRRTDGWLSIPKGSRLMNTTTASK